MAQKPRISAVVSRKTPEGRLVFGVIAKRTYAVSGSVCIVSDDQQALVEEPVLDEDDEFQRDTDLILQRPYADVLVEGHVYSTRPSTRVEATIRIGEHHRSIIATGDRKLLNGSGVEIAFSDPEPFTQLPIDWSSSYGGVDMAALSELGDPSLEMAELMGREAGPEQSLFAYPRNPKGKGYLLEPTKRAIEMCELPNLEYADSLLTPDNIVRKDLLYWPLAPRPVGLGWLPYTFFPRSAALGMLPTPYQGYEIRDEDIPEVRDGVLPARCLDPDVPLVRRWDIGLVQSAAVGMRQKQIRPDEKVCLEHFHPNRQQWQWRLPGEVPRMAFQIPGEPLSELKPQIRAMHLQPEKDLVCVIWVAESVLQAPLTERQLNEMQHGVVWSA